MRRDSPESTQRGSEYPTRDANVQQEGRPRARSSFAAAFLSLIFPGLGHAYAGAGHRALAFAAPPILLIALIGGIVLRMNKLELAGILIQPEVLLLILIVNILPWATGSSRPSTPGGSPTISTVSTAPKRPASARSGCRWDRRPRRDCWQSCS